MIIILVSKFSPKQAESFDTKYIKNGQLLPTQNSKTRRVHITTQPYAINAEPRLAVRAVMDLSAEGRRGMGRPKNLFNGIECDMRTLGVYVNDVGDRQEVCGPQGGRPQIAWRMRKIIRNNRNYDGTMWDDRRAVQATASNEMRITGGDLRVRQINDSADDDNA